jgi:hypothetical protein
MSQQSSEEFPQEPSQLFSRQSSQHSVISMFNNFDVEETITESSNSSNNIVNLENLLSEKKQPTVYDYYIFNENTSKFECKKCSYVYI